MFNSTLFFVKPVDLLVFVNSDESFSVRRISKGIDCNVSHVLELVSKLESVGLVISWRDGRTRQVRLTDRGVVVANELVGVVNCLRGGVVE